MEKNTHNYGRFKVLIFIFLMLNLSCSKEADDSNTKTISGSVIIGTKDWQSIVDADLNAEQDYNAKAVADIRIPVMRTRCTGFLISKNILMTNNHCIPSPRYAKGVTAIFNHVKGVPKEEYRRYDCSEFIHTDRTLDFSLLRCQESPGLDFGFVQLDSTDYSPGDSIYVIHQNCDYYTNRRCDFHKKISFGKLVRKDRDFIHNADTLGGSSGSPVFHGDSHKVMAIHHAGRGNIGRGRGYENLAVPMSLIMNVVNNLYPEILSEEPSDVSNGDNNRGDVRVKGPGHDFKSALKIQSFPFQLKAGLKSNIKDYFELVAQTGAEVKITFSHADGDLDLAIYDEAGKLVAKSETLQDKEVITMPRGGHYFAVVYGYAGASNDYELLVTKNRNDINNTTLKNALPLKKGKLVLGKINAVGEKRFYSFTVDEELRLGIKLDFKHNEGDLDLFVIDDRGSIIAKSEGYTDQEMISTIFQKGEYDVIVKGYEEGIGKFTLELY